MTFNEGCVICSEELIYSQETMDLECFYCGQYFQNNVNCPSGHYVCDNCHSGDANDLIEKFCNNTNSTDPIDISNILMRNEKVKMHGPEHHFLVPAVLLSAYYNKIGNKKKKIISIQTAKKRAGNVLGGFCGTHGTCGAGMGAGIFLSLITGSTPLAEKEWRLSNTLTAQSLLAIAQQGGPRCCKRDSYTSINVAIDFLKENFNTELPKREIKCEFSLKNKQCKLEDCQYYQN